MQRRKKWIIFAIFSGVSVAIGVGYGCVVISSRGAGVLKSGLSLAIRSVEDVFGQSMGSGSSGKEVILDETDDTESGEAAFTEETVPSEKVGAAKSAISEKKTARKPEIAIESSSMEAVFKKLEPIAASAASGSPPLDHPSCGYSCAISIAFSGGGRGMVTSTPPGILCDGSCSWGFSQGGTVTLKATPDLSSSFGGWTGACSGKKETCILSVSSSVSVTANFLPAPSSVSAIAVNAGSVGSQPALASVSSPAALAVDPASDSSVSGHLLIAAVQIGGASSSNDLIKIFNPKPIDADVGGWRLRKRSDTGAEYSIRQFPKGTMIAAGKILTWANSIGGFSGSVGADVSSSETLSANNSIALLDASGTVVDAVSWGTGTDQFSEGLPFATNPEPGDILLRKTVDGVMQDTNNNENDFSLEN